jgi:hypothetical protein
VPSYRSIRQGVSACRWRRPCGNLPSASIPDSINLGCVKSVDRRLSFGNCFLGWLRIGLRELARNLAAPRTCV